MIDRVLILGVSCVLVVGSQQAAVAQTAPLEFVGGRPVVTVRINAKGPYRFILDTGASGNVIAEKIAREAGLEQIGEARVASPAAGAEVSSVPIFGIDSVEIGQIVITGTRAASLPLPAIPGAPPIDGVLSPGAFAGRLLTIDYPKAQVRRASPAPQAAPQTRTQPASTLSLPASGVDVPLRLVGGRPLVSVQINGKGPYTFLLDTGASGQARADTSLVEAMKLEVVGEARGAAGTGGQVVAMPIVRFDTLEIGGATISGVSAPSRDYNTRKDIRIDGILGLNLFKDCLVTLDFERGRLRLERGSLPAPDGREVFAFTNPRGIAELSIRVGDTDVLADVDTGAMGGITIPLSLAATLPLASPPAVVGRAVTISGPMEISAAPLKGAVTIGRYSIADPTLEFTPAMLHGNLGIDALSQFAITFDQQNRRLRLSRSSNEPIRLTKHR